MDASTDLPIPLVLGVVAGMVLAAALLLRAIGTDLRWQPVLAIARAALQLAGLALILSLVFTSVWTVLGWLVVMLVVAILTSARRMGWSRESLATAAWSISLAAIATLAVLFLSGAIGFAPQYLLAMGGIIIGNVMSITSVTAKRLREHLRDSRDEIEGMLALGATPRQAAHRFRGLSVGLALVPNLDSTATTGLVTLPGAYVGAIFAGADPIQAGLFQLLVLAGILFGGSIAGATASWILGAPRTLPVPPHDVKGPARAERRGR